MLKYIPRYLDEHPIIIRYLDAPRIITGYLDEHPIIIRYLDDPPITIRDNGFPIELSPKQIEKSTKKNITEYQKNLTRHNQQRINASLKIKRK